MGLPMSLWFALTGWVCRFVDGRLSIDTTSLLWGKPWPLHQYRQMGVRLGPSCTCIIRLSVRRHGRALGMRTASQLPSRGSQLAMADSEVISQCNVPPHDTEVLLPGSLSIFVPHWILLHSGRRFPVPSFSLVVLISFCLLRRNIEGQACCRLELQNA